MTSSWQNRESELTSPGRQETGSRNIGLAKANEWYSPFSPLGSIPTDKVSSTKWSSMIRPEPRTIELRGVDARDDRTAARAYEFPNQICRRFAPERLDVFEAGSHDVALIPCPDVGQVDIAEYHADIPLHTK